MPRIQKREKIIAGAIIGLVAVGAVHMFLFQDMIKRYQREKGQFQRAKADAANLQKMPARKARDDYNKLTQSDARLFWQTAFDTGLMRPPFYVWVSDPPLPENAGDAKAVEAYKVAKAAADLKKKIHEIAATASVVERLESLIHQKAAYEGGKEWPSDPKADGKPLTNKMKLSFLGKGNPAKTKHWNLPISLPSSLRDEAKLWDEVNRLYERWDVLNLLSRDSEDYEKLENRYKAQLKQLGVDANMLPVLGTEVNELLPQFIRLLQARLIWRQRQEGQVVRVGRNIELTLDLLKRMFRFEPQPPVMVAMLDAPLFALQRMLPLARKNGVEDIQAVEISKYKDLLEYKKKSDIEVAKAQREGGGRRRNIGGGEPMAATTGRQEIPEHVPHGVTCLIRLVFIASNESAMRFLYDVAQSPDYYRLHDLTMVSIPPEGEKVLVSVRIEKMFALYSVTYAGAGALDPETAMPISLTGGKQSAGTRFYFNYYKKLDELGLNTVPAMEKALRDANLYEKSWLARIEQARNEFENARSKAQANKKARAARKQPKPSPPGKPAPKGTKPPAANPGGPPPNPAAAPDKPAPPKPPQQPAGQ